MLVEGQNSGVLWRDIQPEDDIAGGLTRVVPEVRVEDGQWDIFGVSGYQQNFKYGDCSGCTNFTCTHSIECQINRMLLNNEIPEESLDLLNKHGFLVDGKIKLSPRYNYLKSGTVPGVGNYLYKPWDSARNQGMIPYSMLPNVPEDQDNPPYTRERYADPSVLTPEMDEVAEVFRSIFLIQYQVVNTDHISRAEARKQAPNAIITGVCKSWNDPIVQACGIDSGHAVLENGHIEDEAQKIFDSYKINQKQLAWDYPVKYAINGVVSLRDTKWSHTFVSYLKMGDNNDEVKALQIALFLDGVLNDQEWDTQEKVQKWGGYFGENTFEAVKRFQKKYGVTVTGVVGPVTLSKLNSLYS